jgi:hypothetical protein
MIAPLAKFIDWSVIQIAYVVAPLRHAPKPSGNPFGPSLYHLLEVMGKRKVMARVEKALGNAGFGR